MTTTTTGFMDGDGPGLVLERLWRIGDVARFLTRCENTARKLASEPDSPAPVYVDGDGALWDPRDWWAWSARRSAAETKRRAKAAAPKGRGTRV